MKLEIHCPDRAAATEPLPLRVLLFNDSYDAVAVSRNALVGPNLEPIDPGGHPYLRSVEPTFGGTEEPLTLQPFTFYGRERTYDGLPPGAYEVSAYYDDPDGGLTSVKRVVVEPTGQGEVRP